MVILMCCIVCLQACIDTEGSYSCETRCNIGYNITWDNGDIPTCVPYNMCESSAPPCDVNTEVCTGTEGDQSSAYFNNFVMV